MVYNKDMKYFSDRYEKILKKYRIEHSSLKEEFTKILSSKKVEDIFKDLFEAKVLHDVLPEFLPCIGLDQQNVHHAHTVDIHILKAVQGVQQNKEIKHHKTLLLWTMLLHDIGKPTALKKNLKKFKRHKFTDHEKYSTTIAKKVLKRFEFEKAEIKKIVQLVRYHEFFRYIKLYNMQSAGNRMSTRHTFDLINKIGENNFELLIYCHKADYEAQSDYWKEHKNTLNLRARDMLTYYRKLKNAKMKVTFD